VISFMKSLGPPSACTVNPLTIAKRIASAVTLTVVTATLAGCSVMEARFSDTCNSHAYVRTVLADHISSRYASNAPVRMAIIPFAVPANIAAYDNENPGVGNALAWKIQAGILQSEQIPIAEVLNRQDWPGKKEEFFTGNFGSIGLAREAGYDLVLVGYVEGIADLSTMVAFSKIIETESGMTLWYSKTTAQVSGKKRTDRILAHARMGERRPDILYTTELIDDLAECIVRDSMSEDY